MEKNSLYQKYQAASLSTLTPEELLVFLYRELIASINQGIVKIGQKKLPDAHNSIIKAQNIVQYLIDILDLNYPIADELLKIYGYLYERLVSANTQKDPDILKEILPLITELKDTWQQAGQKIKTADRQQEKIG